MKKQLYRLFSVLSVLCFLFYTTLSLISLYEFHNDPFEGMFQFWILASLLGLLLLDSFFLIKGIFNQFNNLKNNYTLLIINLLIIVLITIFIYYATGAYHTIFGGWTAYPPLSALPNNSILIMREKYAECMLFLWTAQMLLLIIIIFVSTKIGKLIAIKYKA